MKPQKPAPRSEIPVPKKRFRLRKLEERIAPKGPPFSKRFCQSF